MYPNSEIFMQLANDVYEHILQSHSAYWKVGLGPTKKIISQKINIMSDAQDPYDLEVDAMGEDIHIDNAETKFDGKGNQET